MRTLLLLLAILATPVVAGEIWKWVDRDGVTHYSDTPVEGAVKVQVSTGNTWNSGGSAGGSESPSAPRKDASPGYQTFEIWKPANEETFSNTEGNVDVAVRLSPALQPGHSLFLYLDGHLVDGYPDNATEFSLKDLERGAHSVVAVVNDKSGTRITETSAVHFFTREASLLQPNRQVAPPPRPTPKK
jgi:Domain of unknown function (DUF4124)